MAILKLFVTLTVSYLGVIAQTNFAVFNQWIVIYFTVFFVSWFGGFFQGIVSTVFSLTVAGFLLIPRDQFTMKDLIELVVLACLGWWISFSMDQYKKSRIKLSASEQLVKSLGFVDTLLENIPLMVFVKDAKDLKFVKFNTHGLQLLGFGKEELLGKSDLDFFPPEQAAHFVAKDREVLQLGQVVDIPTETIQTKSRGERILHTRKIPILDSRGEPLYLLGVSEDITELLAAEKEKTKALADESTRLERLRIQESETFVAQAISSLSTTLDFSETLFRLVTIVVPSFGDWATLVIKNEDGELQRVASLHSEPTLAPLVHELARDFRPGEKDLEIIRAFEEGKSTLLALVDLSMFTARSLAPRQVELYQALGVNSIITIPIKFRDKVLGVMNVVRGKERPLFDGLDLLMGEEIGRRAGTVLENSLLFQATQKAVQARDEFLQIASHELKTPITSLKMQLQMLQRSRELETISKPLTNAVKQVDRLTMLVNDLLDINKFESGKLRYDFKKFSLSELVLEVTENVKNDFLASKAELSVEVLGTCEVDGDHYRLEQVLGNLLSNALKYGRGTPVKVTVSTSETEAIVSVQDQGSGIPEEYQSKIFDKFERGKQDSNISGLGLGLFISREIVLAHNGRLEVRSQKDQGSEFRLVLPHAK